MRLTFHGSLAFSVKYTQRQYKNWLLPSVMEVDLRTRVRVCTDCLPRKESGAGDSER